MNCHCAFSKHLYLFFTGDVCLAKKKTSEVKMFVGVAKVLIAHSLRTNSNSKIIAGSRSINTRVRECHVLSVNFTGQQQNKNFDVTEINLWLEFTDVIFGGTSDSRKYVYVRRLPAHWKQLLSATGIHRRLFDRLLISLNCDIKWISDYLNLMKLSSLKRTFTQCVHSLNEKAYGVRFLLETHF